METPTTNKGEKAPTVGSIAAADHRKARIFKEYGLEFCCGGKHTVKEACEKVGVDYQEVLDAIEKVEDEGKGRDVPQFNDMPLDQLADYIVSVHHAYVRKAIPRIVESLDRVVMVHGQKHPELEEIRKNFTDLREELEAHMEKEEQVLFPYIREMISARDNGDPLPEPAFGSIANPIAMMEAEHQEAGDAIERIRELSNDHQPPKGACNTFRMVYGELKDFADDLHQHIHLENNILFPKAQELEKAG